MSLQRIILTVPFLKHYAGSVFELAPHVEGSEDDYIPEKVSFPGQNGFMLPDGGRGNPVHLSKSDTIPCPEHLFDGVALDGGPCRVTAIHSLHDPEAGRLDGLDTLFDTESGKGQGICIQFGDAFLHGEVTVVLSDVQDGRLLSCPYVQAGSEFRFDFSGFLPGFYRISLTGEQGTGFLVHWIKCFPLVAKLDERGRQVQSVMATIY